MAGAYRGFVVPRVFASRTAAEGSIPGQGDVALQVYENGEAVEYTRDDTGLSTDLIMADNSRWRREVVAADAILAVADAVSAAGAAVAAAQVATDAANAAALVAPAAADAIRAQVATDADRAEAAAAQVPAVQAEIAAPFQTAMLGSATVTRVDAVGNAIEVMRPTGLDAHMADEFWERAPVPASLSTPFEVVEGMDATATRLDAAGNAIEVMRADGLDAHMSSLFWQRGAAMLGAGTPGSAGLSTTEVQAVTVNGQSLTVSGDYTASVTVAAMRALRSDAALMLGGLQRSDGVPLTDVLGPRSFGYNTAPATGLVRAEPHPNVCGMPFPLAVAINPHRADLGLPQIPVVTTAHGISGTPIEQMDDDPLTGENTDTIIWGNYAYWYQQMQAAATAGGKTLRVPWHVMTHGTSAKGYPRGDYAAKWWSLQDDSLAHLEALGLPLPRYIITQSGGDAGTTTNGETWAVVDDQLDICEAGGAVLATPLYWYEISDNNVHPDAEAQALYCDTIAWAMAEVEAGRRWTITRPVATWDAVASVLVLDFASLREDEWLEAEDAAKYAASGGIGLGAAHLGFEAVGATITGLTLRGRTVRLACSAKPTAVQYAMQVQDMSIVAGNRYNAHRGLLRTSTRKPSKLVPGKLLVRAIPSFTLPIV